MEQLIFPLLILGAFWLLLIRPQQQNAKKQRSMQDALAVGDRIVTIGGIFGSVVEIGERVRVRVADGSEIEFARQAISQVLTEEESADKTDSTEGEAHGS